MDFYILDNYNFIPNFVLLPKILLYIILFKIIFKKKENNKI